jgi:predicted AlkP superfamily pyrophosphatase or phosphodiesterase
MKRVISAMTMSALAASLALVGCKSEDKGKTAATSGGVPKPTLIVAISIDQLSSDLFNAHRPYYAGGFKRLSAGVVFPAGYQSHAASETCPGHSTILTGSRPARTGIIANSWSDPNLPRKDKDGQDDYGIYCAEDTSAPGSYAGKYVTSPQHLKVPTMGDRLKAVSPKSQVVAVSGKDRGAIMMAGKTADLTVYWAKDGFETYKGQEASLPKITASVNEKAKAMILKPTLPSIPSHCKDDAERVKVGTSEVGPMNAPEPGNTKIFRSTPSLDALTTDLAIGALQERKLGQNGQTDILAVSLSATDYVGHSFGTNGQEMCVQMAELDKHLGRLFAALDKTGVDYTVVLTADHGGHDLPERNAQNGLPTAERAKNEIQVGTLGEKLAEKYKLPEPAIIGDGPFGDMYLSAKIPAGQRNAVLNEAVAAYKNSPQVEAVFTKAELIAAPAPTGHPEDWSIISRVKASFDPERSGDFYVALKPYVTPITDVSRGYVATHGSPWGYDRRVPILFWWKGVNGFEQPNAIETTDILPSLASLIGLAIPAGEIDGRCVDLLEGTASSCL